MSNSTRFEGSCSHFSDHDPKDVLSEFVFRAALGWGQSQVPTKAKDEAGVDLDRHIRGLATFVRSRR